MDDKFERISDLKIGESYAFDDYFVGKIKLELLGIIPNGYMKSDTLVWMNNFKPQTFYSGLGNVATHTKDLQVINPETLQKIIEIINEKTNGK